nr:uncharacterized protein LOC109157302 isoform X1 [Ipomoea trifida]
MAGSSIRRSKRLRRNFSGEVQGIIDQGNQNVMTDSMSSNDFVSPPVVVAPLAQLNPLFDDSDNGPAGEERDELQKEPNLFECFEHMHKKKNGAFVDERSKKIVEKIQARHDAATQEVEGSTEPPVINMSQLYVDVVGGVKKQRIYGLGTKASSFINDNSCSSSATSQFHQDTMKEMLDTMRVEMEAQMEAKLQAERTQMQAQMQAQIASLMDELRHNDIIPTTSTPQPPTTEGHSVNSNDEDLGDD